MSIHTESHHFAIAEFHVKITFSPSAHNSIRLLPSFQPFAIADDGHEPDIWLTVDDALKPIGKELRTRMGNFDTGNGHIVVDKVSGDEGGYQYIVKDTDGTSCCLLQTSADFRQNRCALNGNYNHRTFGLNNAMMLCFAFATSFQDTLLVHASLVRKDDFGYAFTAKSGTGKSTHTSLWLKHIEGCDLMNDDNPIIRIKEGTPYIYGSPWSGKTPCYRNIRARLGAVVQIDRAPENSIDRLPPPQAFAIMLPSSSTMKWDKPTFDNVCNTISTIISTTSIYMLHCRPDEEAARICHKTIAKNQA